MHFSCKTKQLWTWPRHCLNIFLQELVKSTQKSYFRGKYSDSGPPEYDARVLLTTALWLSIKVRIFVYQLRGRAPVPTFVTCFSNTDIITQGEKTMGCCRLPACASTPQANLALCADRHPGPSDRSDLPAFPPLCRQCCDGWHVSGYKLVMQFAAQCANRHSSRRSANRGRENTLLTLTELTSCHT
jgi:hypothetical protein